MSLAVVIVNFEGSDLTLDCLRSLQSEVAANPGVRVIVVDNGSKDDSVERLTEAIEASSWGDWVHLMADGRNDGYAAGNNKAFRYLLEGQDPPDYVWILNSDTLVRDGAIQIMLTFMEEHPDVGIAGSRLEAPDGTAHRSAFQFSSVWSELEGTVRLGIVSRILSRFIVAPPNPLTATGTDWVCGASMVIRRETLEQVGLLDENYFMYYEDMDYCLAASGKGWACWYVPECRVMHLEGQTSGIIEQETNSIRRPSYYFDSRRRYFVKNYGLLTAILADLAWITGFILWRIRRRLQAKPDTDPPKMLHDFVLNSVLIKKDIR